MKTRNENIIERGEDLVAGSGLGWQGADQALVATAATRAAEAKPTKEVQETLHCTGEVTVVRI